MQAGIELSLAVLPEAAALLQPAERPLHHPSFRQHHESVQFVAWALHISKPRRQANLSVGAYRAAGTFRISGSASDSEPTLGRQPQVPAHQGDGIHEGRRRLGVPSRCAVGRGSLLPQQMGRQGGPGEEASSGSAWCESMACSGHWRWVSTPRSPHLLEGDLQLPAQHPFQDLRRVRRRIGAETRPGELNSPWGSRTKTPARGTGGLPDRYQTAVCEVSPNVRVVPSYQAADTVAQDTWASPRSGASALAAAGLSAEEADRSDRADGVGPVHKGRRPGASGR